MKQFLPFIPIYFAIVPVIGYIVKHEKEHTRLWLLVVQLCEKAHIKTGE